MKDIAIFLAGSAMMAAGVGMAFWWWLGCDGWSFC